jgi:hypothetical protein
LTLRLVVDYGRPSRLAPLRLGRIAALWEGDLLRLTSDRLPTPPPSLPNLVNPEAMLTCDDGSPVDAGLAAAELVRSRASYGFAGVNGT